MYENVRRFFQSLWKCAAWVCRLGRNLQAWRRVCAGLGVTSYSKYSHQVKTFERPKECVLSLQTPLLWMHTHNSEAGQIQHMVHVKMVEKRKKNTSSHLMIDFTHHMTDTGNQTCVCAMCYTVCLRWLQLESIFPQDDTSHPSPALPASPCLIIHFAYLLPALLQLILLSWWTTPWLKVTFFTYPIIYRTVLRQSSKLHKMCVRTQ